MRIAQNWRLNGQRYALKAVRCESCNRVIFPPREVCPACAEKNAQVAAVSVEQFRVLAVGVKGR